MSNPEGQPAAGEGLSAPDELYEARYEAARGGFFDLVGLTEQTVFDLISPEKNHGLLFELCQLNHVHVESGRSFPVGAEVIGSRVGQEVQLAVRQAMTDRDERYLTALVLDVYLIVGASGTPALDRRIEISLGDPTDETERDLPVALRIINYLLVSQGRPGLDLEELQVPPGPL